MYSGGAGGMHTTGMLFFCYLVIFSQSMPILLISSIFSFHSFGHSFLKIFINIFLIILEEYASLNCIVKIGSILNHKTVS